MIHRYFSDENFDRLRDDFQFLTQTFKSFKGELEFSLRDNYFNLYFRGHNAAKVAFRPNGKYGVSIHEKFYPYSLEADARFAYTYSGNYRVIETTSEFLHPLLQKSYLDEIYSKIKKENHSEELAFEQMLITDNSGREELILIDRQVTDTQLNLRRMDLLALKQMQGRQYQFLILEVKMGNNPELKDKVASQLSIYVDHVDKYFSAYKACYEKHYFQKRIMGVIEKPDWDTIEIVPNVQGMIVVGGYSGIAKEQIKILNTNYPELKVQLFEYKITNL
ncbi:MAG: hypothetical protein J7M17_04875 [Anaerolineae bacterium]|nr:hypothetical protein [Anaerolineae bacterium]